MLSMSVSQFVMLMSISLLVMGVLSLASGIFILVSKAAGKELNVITSQTTRLAQKGIAEDVAGLVGNASSLIDALNQLVRTSAGIGIFLVIVGLVLLLAAFYMVQRL